MKRETKQGPSRKQVIILGILYLSLAFGIGIFFNYRTGAPPAESLRKAEGVITSFREEKEHMFFRLSGHENEFSFVTFGDDPLTAARAFIEVGDSGKAATVLHDRPNRRPIVFGDMVATAYQLEIGGKMIWSWEETDEHWRREARLFQWFAAALWLLGAYLLFDASRKRGEPAV